MQLLKSAAYCVICGNKDIERNHVGGRNHIAWFTMPFCLKHHRQFHALLKTAGVDLEYTADPRERLRRGIQACLLAVWILTEAQKELDSHEPKEIAASNCTTGDKYE